MGVLDANLTRNEGERYHPEGKEKRQAKNSALKALFKEFEMAHRRPTSQQFSDITLHGGETMIQMKMKQAS